MGRKGQGGSGDWQSDTELVTVHEIDEPRQQQAQEHVLVCTECGVESPSGAEGWRGYEADDDEILFFCPDCSEREFEGE